MTTTRVAGAADGTTVATLLVAQLRELELPADEQATARLVATLIERPRRARFVVAENDGQLVGVAALSFAWPIEYGAPAVWLEELYVMPAWRAHGVGTHLLREAERVAAEGGAVAVDLEVDDDHPRAAALYGREGYAPLLRRHWVKRLTSTAAKPVWPTTMHGGCFCGAVRYALTAAPVLVSYCHCTMCRRTSGAPMVAWATYAPDAFRWEAASARELQSSAHARRTFCPSCGTPLTFGEVPHGTFIDVTVGSMDDPASMPPRTHIWTSRQLPWMELHDDLRRWPADLPQSSSPSDPLGG